MQGVRNVTPIKIVFQSVNTSTLLNKETPGFSTPPVISFQLKIFLKVCHILPFKIEQV